MNKPTNYHGNKNAVKDDSVKKLSYIHARCTRKEKAAYVHEAKSKGMKLTDWVIETLNMRVEK